MIINPTFHPEKYELFGFGPNNLMAQYSPFRAYQKFFFWYKIKVQHAKFTDNSNTKGLQELQLQYFCH